MQADRADEAQGGGLMRSMLFVPGDRPERFAKADATPADAVILDLEDAVTPQRKPAAREAIAGWLGARGNADRRIWIRVNDAATPWHADDLALAARHAAGVMLPKCESGAQIARLIETPGTRVLALIETARGVQAADEIAAAGPVRLAFGTLDYISDLDLSGEERGLEYASARIAHASRIAGLPAPIAGVTPDIDADRVAADLAFARAFGFGAKLCIHPLQVGAVLRALCPPADRIDWARRVLDAARGESGAFLIDGRMVDRPVVLRARRLIELAERCRAASA